MVLLPTMDGFARRSAHHQRQAGSRADMSYAAKQFEELKRRYRRVQEKNSVLQETVRSLQHAAAAGQSLPLPRTQTAPQSPPDVASLNIGSVELGLSDLESPSAQVRLLDRSMHRVKETERDLAATREQLKRLRRERTEMLKEQLSMQERLNTAAERGGQLELALSSMRESKERREQIQSSSTKEMLGTIAKLEQALSEERSRSHVLSEKHTHQVASHEDDLENAASQLRALAAALAGEKDRHAATAALLESESREKEAIAAEALRARNELSTLKKAAAEADLRAKERIRASVRAKAEELRIEAASQVARFQEERQALRASLQECRTEMEAMRTENGELSISATALREAKDAAESLVERLQEQLTSTVRRQAERLQSPNARLALEDLSALATSAATSAAPASTSGSQLAQLADSVSQMLSRQASEAQQGCGRVEELRRQVKAATSHKRDAHVRSIPSSPSTDSAVPTFTSASAKYSVTYQRF